MARKSKSKKAKRSKTDIVFFNVRMPEWLRRDLERAATANNRSMNTEILRRLVQPFNERDRAKIIASALVRDLDDEIVNEIVNIVRRIDAEEAAADAWREEEHFEREAAQAADLHAEHLADLQREGGAEEGDSK